MTAVRTRRYAVRRTQIIASLLLVAIVACGGAGSRSDDTRNQFTTSDDKLVEVAEAVPGFGGYYGDRDTGQLVIWLVDPEQRAPAESELIAAFGPDVIPEAGIRVREGQYGFDQLKLWQREIEGGGWAALDLVSTDVADELNRVRNGVTSEAGQIAVLAEMDDNGIPVEAVIIKITRPAQAVPAVETPGP